MDYEPTLYYDMGKLYGHIHVTAERVVAPVGSSGHGRLYSDTDPTRALPSTAATGPTRGRRGTGEKTRKDTRTTTAVATADGRTQ